MRCISIDLEVAKKYNRIFALAAVNASDGRALTFSRESLREVGMANALERLDEFARQGDCLVGHNLVEFDIPHLRAAKPALRLLRKPMLDTLRLSPLAFPKHPYHHLVKHYQDGGLVRGQINNPKLDAQLALDLLDDERRALRNANADLLVAWHWLTTRSSSTEGFDAFFADLRGAPRPSETQALAAIGRRLAGNVCDSQGKAALAEDRDGWPLAYVLAWLSVAGGNSVMPPWVRHQFPEAGQLVRRLRDRPCRNPACSWCRQRHDAARELKRWFGFDGFRPQPATETGNSMQEAIVRTAMAGGHVLGVLPTGAGKSLCYQLPAISRYDKTGALTVVISPLVALMADQVAAMRRDRIACATTINGLISMPERAEALAQIRLGYAGIVLVAPEQLRNRSFRKAIAGRRIGAWVIDEAHCLSKWGHDFRPDYRYVARYIAEHHGEDAAPILCLTATAKHSTTSSKTFASTSSKP